MDYETLVVIQEYTYVIFPGILAIVLYSYIYHLYKSEKDGTRDYEKYGKIALDDEIDSQPIESKPAGERD
jgi:cytochrome c oxidase cbb3-type subunit 4